MKQHNRHKKIDIFFKRWSRKKHGIFSSLKKNIKICTLLVTYTILNSQNPAAAQTDTIFLPQKIEVEEVEIIGQRTPGVYSVRARVVTVVSSAELNAAPAQSLNDLLEFLPGIDIRQRGIFGVQADIGIRGGSFDQALILINGIPFNDPQTGHHSLNLPFPFSAVEKAEILEGPGSRIYGANAFSGVLNIITKTGHKEYFDIAFKTGAHHFYSPTVSAGIKTGKLSNFISLSATTSKGYTDNTDFKDFSGYYSGNFQANAGELKFQAGYTSKAFGANSFYTARYPEQFEQVKNKFLALTFKTDKTIDTKSYFIWRRHHDRFELFREDRFQYRDGYFINASDTAVYSPGVYAEYNYYPGHNYHLTDVFTGGFNMNIPNALGVSSLGFEYKFDRILSNILGLPLDHPSDVPGEPRGQFTKSDRRSVYNIFAGHTSRIKTFYFSAGALCFVNNANRFNVFLGGDVSKKTGENSRLFFSVNQSLRLPTYTDLYYSGPSNMGNPGLKPEKAVTIEGGYRKGISVFNFQISAFNRAGKDIIDWVKLPADTKYTTMNYTRLNTYGFEIQSGYNNAYNMNIINWLNYCYIHYSFIQTGKRSGDYISAYALDYLKHKLSARLNHKVFKSFNISWNLTWQDRNGTFTDKELTEQDYKPFLLVNTRVTWKPEKTEIYIEGSNLFNEKYRDFGSVVQPGLWIFAGIRLEINPGRLK